MTSRRILIIDGHPDPEPARFVHALARRYADGAESAGHLVRGIRIGELDFPFITSRHDWDGDYVPNDIRRAQEAISWAEHLVILYPLWLGDVPALLKAFFEQVMRPGFAFNPREGRMPEKQLKGRSAQIVVTMGMPALLYRTFYGAHSVKSLERNILRFVGIGPIRHTLIGDVEGAAAEREAWLDDLFGLGEGAL
ncbi:NAD(P)H-dependent oxidoreductase [Flavisphingomonas formosensis]|uniref:NAD(P)H-dependent oxidoreductase n=1 Tax=Flavisphingomonas formosensis TaxID=861534 RepID=UPI0012F875BC|nr:NAD(P)H-dependent oxidoreductase [Sphingomonas formosensis]